MAEFLHWSVPHDVVVRMYIFKHQATCRAVDSLIQSTFSVS
jgi:hypothetical protein